MKMTLFQMNLLVLRIFFSNKIEFFERCTIPKQEVANNTNHFMKKNHKKSTSGRIYLLSTNL